jgi:hypothetical protein
MAFDSPEKKRAYEKEYFARPEVAQRRKENFQRWSGENKEHLKEREAKRRLEKRALCLIATSRTRAKKKGLEFDLERYADEIQTRIDKGVCEITGELFDLSPGRKFNSPSLDRIDSKRGYTYDNVRIVLNMVNQALGDWGQDVAERVIRNWAMQSMPSKRRRSSKAILTS